MRRSVESASLRRRLLKRLISPLLLLFSLSGMVSYGLALHYASSVYDGWLYDSASSLALVIDRVDGRLLLNLPAPAEQLFVWDVADTTFYSVRGERAGLIAGRHDIPDAAPTVSPYRNALLFDGVVEGREVRVARLEVPAARFGERVTVEVAETKAKRHTLAREILLSALVPELLLILVAAAVISLGVRTGLKPLAGIGGRLAARSYRDLSPLSEDDVPTEIRPLTGALNDLLQRLDAALAAQRKFVADAAHQLRTPLTALKLHLAEARREITPEGWRRELVQLECAVERAARLSNQMLSLARVEPQATPMRSFEPLDLNRIAQQTGAEWVLRALAKKLELSFEGAPQAVWVQGERELLCEALNNLLDNAVKYHPGPGRILLGVGEGAVPTLSVSDDGPGVPAEDYDRLFVRFFRGDTGRASGSGLGLAIVKEIVQLHGGSVAASSGLSDRGLCITIKLPATVDQPPTPGTARS